MNIALTGKGDTQKNIIYDGNSFWASPYNVPQYITAGLTGFQTVNFGVGAQSIGVHNGSINYMLYDINTQVLPLRNENRAQDIIVVFEGINDLYYQLIDGNANAVDTVYNNFVQYIELAISNGFSIIVNTLTPRTNTGTPAGYEAARQAVNTKLRSIFSASTNTARVFCSYIYRNAILCDVGNDPNYGQTGQTTNTTYYQSDLVHPTATMGQSMATNYYLPAIQMLN